MTSLAVSPDGRLIASGDAAEAIKIWEAITDEEIHSSAGPSGVIRSVAFSPDGSRLAGVTGFGRVMIWDAKNGTELMNLNGGGSFVAFSSEGQTIISSHNLYFKY